MIDRRPQSAELLRRIVATGRASGSITSDRRYAGGEPREGRVEWAQVSKHGVAPHLIVPEPYRAQRRTAGLCRCSYQDDRTGGTEPAARPASQFWSAPRCRVPRCGSFAPSRPGLAGTPSRSLPGHAAPAAGIDEDPVLILRLQRGHVNTAAIITATGTKVHRPIGVAHLSFRVRADRDRNFGAGELAGSVPRRSRSIRSCAARPRRRRRVNVSPISILSG